jgi:hypothetical protein
VALGREVDGVGGGTTLRVERAPMALSEQAGKDLPGPPHLPQLPKLQNLCPLQGVLMAPGRCSGDGGVGGRGRCKVPRLDDCTMACDRSLGLWV